MLLYLTANENLLIKKAAKADTTHCLDSVFEIAHDVSVDGGKKTAQQGLKSERLFHKDSTKYRNSPRDELLYSEGRKCLFEIHRGL